MSNTYTQIHIHGVFAVQNRQSFITYDWQEDLYRYITGIIQNHGHKLLSIGGMSDHVHVFFGMRPAQSLSSLMQDIKCNSSGWINKQKLTDGRFSWQEGFGAFSYSRSQVAQVIKYIQSQKQHHSTTTFLEEYQCMLKLFGIDYDERYLFKPV